MSLVGSSWDRSGGKKLAAPHRTICTFAVCVRACECVCICETCAHVSDCPCVPVWRPKVNVQYLTLLHSTLVFKGGARTEPRVPYLS